jgi:ureidoglycolate hydrolase
MDENTLEICEYTGPGYQPVIDFGAWRVAILNYLEEIHPSKIDFVERHNETDEVFVLIKGKGILFIGEGNQEAGKIRSQVLEPGKMYNVKKGVWHTIVLSPEGSVLIVENQDTRRENSDYFTLSSEHREFILETAKREQPDCWR